MSPSGNKYNLYGLRESAKCRNDTVNEIIEKLAFRKGDSENTKIEGEDYILVLINVNNMLIACKDIMKIEDTTRALPHLGELKTS